MQIAPIVMDGVKLQNGKTTLFMHVGCELVKIWIDGNGYLRYGKDKYVHRLLAEVYAKRKLKRSEIVHHVNHNKLDNSENNLLICKNQKEHMLIHAQDAIRNAGGDPNTHALCGMCRQCKLLINFNKDKSHWNGYDNDCKECKYSYKTKKGLNKRPDHLKWKDMLAQQYRRCLSNKRKKEISWLK